MNRFIATVSLTLLIAGIARTQDQPYRVVFDLTSRDTLEQKAVLRWIREIKEENPKAELEVVMYGKGFELVMPEKSAYLADVQKAAALPDVSFKVCAMALKNNKIEKSQVLKEVQTVPDGIREIINKQHDGWGYIKVNH